VGKPSPSLQIGRDLPIALLRADIERRQRLLADPAVRDDVNRAWHRLDAWPDVTAALARLRCGFRIAPCSNGNISLMVDIARLPHADAKTKKD
jgi:2-haloacid dehalogenase